MKRRMTVLIPLCILIWIIVSKYEWDADQSDFGLGEYLAEMMSQQTVDMFLPVFAFAEEGKTGMTAADLLGDSLLHEVPLYSYCMGQKGTEDAIAYGDNYTHEELMKAEGMDEEYEAEHEMLEEENEEHQEILAQIQKQEEADELTLEQMFLMENENAGLGVFIPHVQSSSYDWNSLQNYETLVSTFYAIDSTTMVGSNQLNAAELKAKDLSISKDDPAPQILIYHTHSKEGFIDSVEGEPSQTILGVGTRLTQILTEQYGYSVLHHTAEYDTVRDQAYAKSLPALEKLLEENPSIQVVIDLHRDAGTEGRHLAINLDGRSTARFMFFNGLSRTRKTGNIEYLENPNLADNLAFSFQMQTAAGEYYPGLTRKIYLKGYRYNMHLKPRTLLIEMGDSNNTLEEAINACDPLAHILDIVLSGQNR